MWPREVLLPADVIGAVTGVDLAVRRPKPLIPLNTALDNVNITSNTSLSRIPAVLMLTSIASNRKGEMITSIATDVRFLVVLVFIKVCLLARWCDALLPRYEQDNYNQCATGPVIEFVGLLPLGCSLWLTTSSGPSGCERRNSAFYLRFVLSPGVDRKEGRTLRNAR